MTASQYTVYRYIPLYIKYTVYRYLPLYIKEDICPERLRKSYALQGAKKKNSLYHQKDEIPAFRPCITLGGLHWAKMGQKMIF